MLIEPANGTKIWHINDNIHYAYSETTKFLLFKKEMKNITKSKIWHSKISY